MATTRTYRPDTDVENDWSISPTSPTTHYDKVDESSPSFSDYVYNWADNPGDREGYKAAESSETYADVPSIPWNSMKVECYARVGISGNGNIELRPYLKVGGTRYYGTSQAVTSTTGETISYTWTSAPWDTTGLINWGYAPNEITFGFQLYVFVPPFTNPKRIDVANVCLKCEHDDHTPETPPAPTDPLVSTFNTENLGTEGEYNPTDLVTWKPKFSCISSMTGDDCCGVRVRIGTMDSSSGDDDVFEGNFYFESYVDNGARTPKDEAQYGGGSGSGVLQDGVTYYWDIALLNEWADAGSWLDGGTFQGVTDFGWWDNDYNRRFNLRAGTDHDALPIGYTRKIDINTGHGVVISETGKMNEAIQHSSRHLAEHEGFLYAVWLDTPTATSDMEVYISKSDDPDDPDSWDTPVMIYDTMEDTDTHKYPSIIVTDDEKLLVIVGGHDNQSRIFRSTNTHSSGTGIDITAWDSAITPSALSTSTYCRPVMTSDGTLFIFYRNTNGAFRGEFCFTKSTDNGATWSTRQYFAYYIDYEAYPPSIYCGGCVVDANDRIHIVLSWWDSYGSDNKGRAVSYIYSDLDSTGTFKEWFELESQSKIGDTTGSPFSSLNVTYDNSSKIDTCSGSDSLLTGDFVHTNSEALALDDDNNPIIIYYYYDPVDHQNDETPIYVATWNGSTWSIVDLYADESLAKLWKYRQGGQLYYQDGYVHIYGFVKPSGETWFGGELYQWRWNTDIDSWSGFYMAKNTGVGIGMMSVLQNPVDGKRAILFVRGENIVFMFDEPTTAVRYDGDDVRVVEADYNDGTPTYTELDRLPQAFQMVHTQLYFPLNTAISADENAPTDKIYQVYVGKHDATNPPKDVVDVFRYLENFEDYSSNSELDGQGGWSVDTPSYMKIFDSTDKTNYINAHTNKLWDGDKFLKITNSSVATKDLDDSITGLGTDLTDKKIIFHIWDEGGGGQTYVELYDDTAAKYVRLGFNHSTEKAGYMTSAASWTDVVTLTGTRYYTFEMTIDSNGVSGYVNGTAVFTNNTEITVFDKIKIGHISSTVTAIFDQLLMMDWVANGPEETDTEDNLDVKDLVSSGRLAHRLVPTLVGADRQAHVLSAVKVGVNRLAEILTPEKIDRKRLAQILNAVATGQARQAQDVIAEITTGLRQSHTLTPEEELSTRLAAAMVANALASDRFAQTVIAELTESGRLAGLAIPEQTIAERCAEILIAEAIGSHRLAQAIQGDKRASNDIANILTLLGVGESRIANILAVETTTSERQAHLAILLKEEISRQCHAAIVEAVDEARIAGRIEPSKVASSRLSALLQGDKHVGQRIAHIVFHEAPASDRLAQYLDVDKITADRIAHLMRVEADGQDRIGQYLQGDKHAFSRIMNTLTALASGSDRIANLLTAEAGASERQAQIIVGLKHELVRVAQTAVAEATGSGRIAHVLLLDKALSDRIAMLLAADKFVQAKIANTLHFEGAQAERLAMILQPEVDESSQLAHALLAEKPSSSRIANIIMSQAATFARLASVAVVESSEIDRMAQLILAEKTATDVLAHILSTEKIVSDRVAQYVVAEMAASARIGNWLTPIVTTSAREAGLLLVEATGRPRLAQLVRFYGRTDARLAQLMVTRYDLSLPDGRSVEIGEELRELIVGAEDRAILISAEDRSIAVESEDRSIRIPEEDRTIDVER